MLSWASQPGCQGDKMNVTKHFCRLITEQELDDEDVIEYFDIVQSVASTKLVTGYTDNKEQVTIEVTAYSTEKNKTLYEIVLSEQLNLDEGEEISDLLDQEFEFDFEFETSMEI